MRPFHRPVPVPSFDNVDDSPDPAQLAEIAHATASLLVHGTTEGRPSAAGDEQRADRDDDATSRFVTLADEMGLETIAEIWASAPAVSLPGVLWRLYALRQWIIAQPSQAAAEFDAGRTRGTLRSESYLTELVAGVENPPGPDEVARAADQILAGAFRGDFAVALLRAAAFTEVCAAGRRVLGGVRDRPQRGVAGHSGPAGSGLPGSGLAGSGLPGSGAGQTRTEHGAAAAEAVKRFEDMASDLVRASAAFRSGSL